MRPLVLCALLVLAACQTAPRGDFCTLEHPERPSAAEIAAMSDARVKEVLAHNQLGVRLCGWTP